MTHTLPVTGNTERTRPENRAFYPALDGIRAVAFLMVFFQHYANLPWGWTGVNVFFVLSGFLITGILFDTRDDPHRARNFYIRRTLRIFPLYYGVFLLLLITTPLFHWAWSAGWIAWPLYAGNFLRFLSPGAGLAGSLPRLAADAQLHGSLHPHSPLSGFVLNLGHFWSLCVEEQFYLVWPWIVFRVRDRRSLLWICGLTVALVPLLRVLAQHRAPSWMLNGQLMYRATPFQLDALLLGGLAGLLWRGAHRERLLAIARWVAAAMTLTAVLCLVHIIHLDPDWFYTWDLSLVDLFAVVVIVCALRPLSLTYRLLGLRPLRWMGRISYGAYVYHDIFHNLYWAAISGLAAYLVQHHGPRFLLFQQHLRWPFILFSLACTLLISWLSFRVYESPFLNLKERWTVRR